MPTLDRLREKIRKFTRTLMGRQRSTRSTRRTRRSRRTRRKSGLQSHQMKMMMDYERKESGTGKKRRTKRRRKKRRRKRRRKK